MDEVASSYDVIVVGAGGSGLAAACTASTNGARVLVLEKTDHPGGTTALAIGSITSPLTWWQQAKRLSDNTDDFADDMLKFAGPLAPRANRRMTRMLAAEAPATVAWLRSLGVSFVGPFPEPPNRVPRMHNVVPGSRAYIAALLSAAQRNGTHLVSGARVVELRRDVDNRVTGVVVENKDGANRTIIATGGVVLATGDYSANSAMKARHFREDARHIKAINAGSTGDGHRLGESVGGQLVNMDIVEGPQLRFPPPRPRLLERIPYHRNLARGMAALGNRMPAPLLRVFAKQMMTAWMAPSPEFLHGGPLLVDANGSVIRDTRSGLAYAVAERDQQMGYLILDQPTAERYSRKGSGYISTAPGIAYAYFDDYRRSRPDLVKKAASFTDLATKSGINPEGLEATAKSAKAAGSLAPAGEYFSMGPLMARFATTEGGLLVDDECHVQNTAGQSIPGLWAAGSVGQSGLILAAHGTHILWAMTSGRIAGCNVAACAAKDAG